MSNLQVVALGTSCVDVFPEKSLVRPGGEALNIAAHLAGRPDVDVFLMGLIGDDDYARVIRDSIRCKSINTSRLCWTVGSTAHHVIHNRRDGDRYFQEGAWHGGVSTEFRLDKDDRTLLKKADGVITTLWEPNLEELVELKREYGFKLAVDFNEQRDFSRWEELIPHLDIFFISAEESMGEAFRARSRRSSTRYVLTFGADGSVCYSGGRAFTAAADAVDKVVDTTGCGDCYQGRFFVEYLGRGDIQRAMTRASEEAAGVATYVGGFPVCP